MPNGKPNILVIWGDDIGISNVSCYCDGLMGYRTPNIDRIADEGHRFTDYYGEQSCTAGRAAFITGQNPIRTGLTKVGMPGADVGLQADDPTIATGAQGRGLHDRPVRQEPPRRPGQVPADQARLRRVLRQPLPPQRRGGARARRLPDEEDFPNFREKFGPRGVIHSWADGRIEDTGPLTKKRMETIDDEIIPEALRFIRDAVESDTPFFVWFNTTGMHFRTHIADEIRGQAGRWQSEYHDGMVEHDKRIGQMLDHLDELGIADDTIVVYSTDNGVHMNTWPDGGMTPFRNEKNSSWEGAFRVPAMVRWPGHIEAGRVLNGLISHGDWFTTLLAAAGEPDIAEKLREGHELNGRGYRVHLDGFNQLPYLTGEVDDSPRNYFFYATDDGDLTALRRTTGSSCSSSSAPPARWRFGRIPSSSCGCRRSSTSAPTPSSAPTRRPTPTTTGCSTTPSCSSRPRRSSPITCRP